MEILWLRESHLCINGLYVSSRVFSNHNKPAFYNEGHAEFPVADSKLITQIFWDDISIGECSFEEMVNQLCCHPH